MKSFKVIRQRDTMQCGVACLNMITRHHGSSLSLIDLENLCTPTSEGVSLKGIIDAADQIGLNPKGGKIDWHDLHNIPLPAMLHWKNNHFVVLYKTDPKLNIFYIADPAKGKYKVNERIIIENWASLPTENTPKGICCIFNPNDNFKSDTGFQNQRPNISHRKFIFPYLKEFKPHLVKIGLALIASSLLMLILPFLTQNIVDIGIRNKDISIIWLILIGEAMIILGRTTIDFFRSRILLKVSTRININMINDFLCRLLKLPIAFFESKQSGDMLQRIADHQRIQQFLTTELISVLFSLINFIVFGTVLLIYNKLIFLIFLAGSALYTFWMIVFLNRRKVLDYEYFEQQAINQNLTYQFLNSVPEIKLQDCGKRRRSEWEIIRNQMMNTNLRSLTLQQQQETGGVIINEFKNLTTTVVAAMAVINGSITLGAMMAIQFIIGQLNSPIERIMNMIYSLQDVKISLDRIGEVHARTPECLPEQITIIPHSLPILFKDVSFKYDRHAVDFNLSDVSTVFESGKITAIVGASGSGKTTMLKLILKYHKPSKGEISLGGNDLNIYNPDSWRKKFGVVMQDGVIFSESILRNIAADDNDVDFKRVRYAAKLSCIDDYIMSLPWKYNTKIGKDGKGLSKGQIQRILIARAIYRDPEFLILDEATNALDATNEMEIINNLNNFFKNRTVIIVAHRLSTVKNADKIVVLDAGRIVEEGTHVELCKMNGVYFNLISNQLELGI